ncbi:cytochrome oxidase putative small subunit CydP [Candidatus Vallotia cooleyia]|uniref:cytochrome oxidase putative small subunit CydP n=1 Tax=Candidatus Vallotiella adelgis TaxID=1177211 RepID=UPI001D02195A|nr:cytochrome oxidase putative small subunit CydP [Candidatus Vallotia cooleyia]UDG82535.1 hypothetical protein GJV44_00825 [Candidatus Vallotia cooleyia]
MPSHNVRHSTDIDCAGHAQHPNVLTTVLRRPGLVSQLILVIIAKIVFLLFFRYTLFSHPQASHMALPPDQVAQALLSVSTSHPPAPGNHYDK